MVAKKSQDWLPAGWTMEVKVKSGRKIRYYTNLETGQKFFSKNDIIRYVKTGNSLCDPPQPIDRQINRRSRNKHMPLVVKTNEFPEWLPKGWIVELKTRKSGSRIGKKYKCYTDPSIGCKFYSKPQVSQYLKAVKRNSCISKQKKISTGMHSASNPFPLTGCKIHSKPEVPQYLKTTKRTNCISKQKKIGIGMHSASNVVVEKVAADGLPPGWIKEIKIRKSTNGIRRDPYYTDAVSGYVFRSKKDVLRYLKTGEISRHAFKPKTRGINDRALINDEISPPSSAKGQKLTHCATRRRLFAGKASSDSSSLALPEAEGPKKRRSERVSAETSTALPKAKGSKRKRGKRVFTENGPVSTPPADILQEKKLLENVMENRSNRKTQINLRKSKNKKELIWPCRSSKRLAGLEPEVVANSGFSERALRVAARNSGKSETIAAFGLAVDSLAHKASPQLEAEPGLELAHQAFKGKEVPLDVEPSDKSEKPLEDQAVPEEQPGKPEIEKKDDEKPESQLLFPFVDSWSDPCLEFAFKTLTGAIPVEDNLGIQGYFQQQLGSSQTQRDGDLPLPDFGLPSFFQSDISSQFEAAEKPVSRQQLPVKPTLSPQGNVSLPSCSGIGPQQPSLEGNNEYQRKVNY